MVKKQEEIILGSFEYKEENKMEWKEKFDFLFFCFLGLNLNFFRNFSLSSEELRCYRDKKDKKPEKIFNLKDFEVKFDGEHGMISLKNPLQIGCSIRGVDSQETYFIFQRIDGIRVC